MLELRIKIAKPDGKTIVRFAKIPQAWQEVQPQHALALCAATLMPQDETTYNNILAVLLPPETWAQLNQGALARIYRHIIWIFSAPLTYPCLPSFTADDQTYYLPLANFADVAMDEWADGMASMMLYEKTGKPEYLHTCIATFCRPRRADYNPKTNPETADNPRETYSAALAIQRADAMAELAPLMQLYIATYIMHCVKAILSHPDYAIIFPKPTPEQAERQKTSPPKLNPAMWYDFAIEAAQLPNLGGDYEKVLKKKVHDVFRAVALHRKSLPN